MDLDAFERTNKAEGLGMSSDANAGETNLYDAETTCKLFRFLQLLCEGHNAGKREKQIFYLYQFSFHCMKIYFFITTSSFRFLERFLKKYYQNIFNIGVYNLNIKIWK